MYRTHGKRFLDLALSFPMLIALCPLLAVVGLLVRVRLGSPVLFRQARAGLHGKPFQLIKFRTMADTRDASGRLLPDAERLSQFGRWLRSTSIDELPSLLNVLRGDMSLVGPRPLFVEYLPRYTAAQGRRHDVRPGVTGLAQVSGRNALSWEQKFELDVQYVERVGFLLDVRIIARTLLAIVRRQGICQEGHATAEEFMGTGY
ncbi:MAG: sugar transferase [Chloroflexi bacterium]|nr:sugar transferase [Chloroflexota bacterium]